VRLKVLDLFSGIGGFSLGLERTNGFETVAFCEIEPFPRKVLAKHWPGVPIYEDVRTLEYDGLVDLVTAGFPCQDISHAGKRAGLAGVRSGLFWQVLRTLCMVGRPRVLLENVAALLGRGLPQILGAFSSFGYDTQWDCIPAGAIGAPHERDRIWIEASDATDKSGLYKSNNGKPKKRLLNNDIAWETCPWDAPEDAVCRMDDGIYFRPHEIAALGNAVVPQVVEMMGRAILQDERARIDAARAPDIMMS
jgi:DNA (cytosine-5)-methyltransferase 1